MTRKLMPALKAIGAVSVILLLILGTHIYLVTRHKAPDAHTVAMARIDIKQPVTEKVAANMEQWLAMQPGVVHVVLNRRSDIAVFTFRPVQANGNTITENFKREFNVKAERFMPSEADLKAGCPVASVSLTGKLRQFFSNLF